MESKPNEFHVINKINFTSYVNIIVRVCMTLKYAKREPIDPHIFLEYVCRGLALGKCLVGFALNKEQELSSCAVLFLNNNPIKGKVLWIEWVWSDGKDLRMGLRAMKKIEELAQKLGVDRIAGVTIRGLEAIYKKYKFKEACTIVEKVIKKEVKNNVEKN